MSESIAFKYSNAWSQIDATTFVEKQLILFSNGYACQIEIPSANFYLITIQMYVDKTTTPPYMMDPVGLPVTIPLLQIKKTISDVNTVLDQVKALTSLF